MKILAAVAALVIGLKLAAAGYPVMLLVTVVIAAVLWVGSGTKAAPAGRVVTGHSHGSTRRFIATHEGGHAVAAKKVGGYVKSARMSDSEGVVHVRIPNDPAKVVAFLRAGREAVGSGRGCSADDAEIRAVLRDVPPKDRGQVRREGERLARRIVSSSRGEIRRFANQLNEKGRL